MLKHVPADADCMVLLSGAPGRRWRRPTRDVRMDNNWCTSRSGGAGLRMGPQLVGEL